MAPWDVGTWVVTTLRKILVGGGVPVVKSVQRGVKPYTSGIGSSLTSPPMESDSTKTFYVDITISSVDTTKCSVSIVAYNGNTYPYSFASATKLRVYISGGDSSTISVSHLAFTYEITEFY